MRDTCLSCGISLTRPSKVVPGYEVRLGHIFCGICRFIGLMVGLIAAIVLVFISK